MTGKDLFVSLCYIDQKYIDEAEHGSIREAPELTVVNSTKKVRKRPRFLLIAAIIVLSLLLVGCVAAVFMGLQQRTVGAYSHIKYQDQYGNTIEPTEVTRDVIAYFGYTGTPHYQALKEWYEFSESYDPERKLMTNTNAHGIPENYWGTYFCYTWEMVEKLDEICEKYDLKILGENAVIQNWDTALFYEALQIDSFLRSDSGMEVTNASGYFYPEGAFSMELDLHPTGKTPRWTDAVWSSILYTGKDWFLPAYSTIHTEIYEEWLYTTTAGVDVTIAMREDSAFFFTEREDAYITVTVAMDPYDQKDPSVREDMEALAELFDFNIRPQPPVDMAAIRKQLADSMAAWEAEQEAVRLLGGSYAEFLCQEYVDINNSIYYTFRDINSDGEPDLLMGNADGIFDVCYTIHENAVVELYNHKNFRICEDGTIAGSYGSIFIWDYSFYKIEGYEPYGFNAIRAERVEYNINTNTWLHWEDANTLSDGVQISEAEAQTVINKYVPIDLSVQPLMNFPVDDNGTTLGEYIEANRVEISREERMQLYGEYLKKEQESAYIPSTHYMLMDMDGDGCEELMLTYDEAYIRNIMTVKNGELKQTYMWTKLRPCKNNIWEHFNTEGPDDRHFYFTVDQEGEHPLDYLLWYGAGNTWHRSADGDVYLEETITESRYQELLEQYVPVPMEWKPVNDFPME